MKTITTTTNKQTSFKIEVRKNCKMYDQSRSVFACSSMYIYLLHAFIYIFISDNFSTQYLLKHQKELEAKEEEAVAEVPAKEEEQEEVLEHPEAPLSRLILSPTALEIDSIPSRKSSMLVKKDPKLRRSNGQRGRWRRSLPTNKLWCP